MFVPAGETFCWCSADDFRRAGGSEGSPLIWPLAPINDRSDALQPAVTINRLLRRLRRPPGPVDAKKNHRFDSGGPWPKTHSAELGISSAATRAPVLELLELKPCRLLLNPRLLVLKVSVLATLGRSRLAAGWHGPGSACFQSATPQKPAVLITCSPAADQRGVAAG